MKNTLFILLWFVVTNYAQSYENINQKIIGLINQLPASTKTAIMVYSPENNEVIFAQNENESMIPASNTKLFTTAAALNFVSPDYEIKTFVLADSINFDTGVISGNLYIKGSGDPELEYSDIDSLVNQLLENGIKEIKGNIIGDDTFFDDVYYRDDWITKERSNVSLPPVSALALHRNKVILRLYRNKIYGQKLGVSVEPDIRFISITNNSKVTRGRSYPRFTTKIKDSEINIRVRGGLKKSRYSRSYAIYIEEPAIFAAMVLQDKLEKAGVKITGRPIKGEAPGSAIVLSEIGRPFNKILALANKKSDNYAAECIFKMTGAIFSGKQGNSFYADQAVHTFLDQFDILDDGTSVVDGSGISRFNTVTCSSIARLLSSVYFNDNIFNAYYNSLSVGGIDGTLKDRLLDHSTTKTFHGKTGTLRGVSSLSGYLITKSDTDLIISIIMEFKKVGHRKHREIQDEIIKAIAEGI